ncbi:hypothetical protein ACEWY4_025581 [Coilia grayii]|uniref:Uncharacterized protein n=1 Tax=Coilia grayii TaxID=363190 RepID=A0ABD1IUG0_9TELE
MAMIFFLAFQTRVLTKLEQVTEVQQELMKRISSAVPARKQVAEPLPRPRTTPMELNVLCDKITREDGFRKQLVCDVALYYNISSKQSRENSMMSRLGTTELWSGYSMRGRIKSCFADLPLMQVSVKACIRCLSEARIADVEREVGEYLKHAPFKKGGSGKVVFF